MQAEIKPTSEYWTAGILNLPLLYDNAGNVIMQKNKSGKVVKAVNPIFRYLFFELDTLEENQLHQVLNTYKRYNLPVYVHRSMRGYHFLSVKPIAKELYYQAINEIKPLNPKCPLVTIRIKSNKWIDEKQVFKIGMIMTDNNGNYDLSTAQLKTWIERQAIGLIAKHFKVLRYSFVCKQCKKRHGGLCENAN